MNTDAEDASGWLAVSLTVRFHEMGRYWVLQPVLFEAIGVRLSWTGCVAPCPPEVRPYRRRPVRRDGILAFFVEEGFRPVAAVETDPRRGGGATAQTPKTISFSSAR